MIRHLPRLAALAAALCLSACQTAPVNPPVAPALSALTGLGLPHIFASNMVLQRGASVPVWGWGDEGETVKVNFRGQTVTTRVKDGKWMVHLRNLKAGGPDVLTISAKTTIEYTNVLVGEVWLAGGQSNMELAMRESFQATNDILSATNPFIRFVLVPHKKLDSPTNDFEGSWSESTPASVRRMTAVGYYFARALQQKLHVPVGIIESYWGGTPAEEWMRRSALNNPQYTKDLFTYLNNNEQRYETNLANFQKARDTARQNGQSFNRQPPGPPWKASELYNGMIAPVIPYAIKGVIWYQGEENAATVPRAKQYHVLFPDLIRNWRQDWHEGEFPFLCVQLAPYLASGREPVDSAWTSVREAHLFATKTLPNVGLAVITDVGERRDIHPKKKQPVGERLALAARAIAYREKIEFSGPIYQKMKIDGAKIVLTFTHAGQGLEAHAGALTGFTIAGADKKFVPATAEIVAPNKIAVSAPTVSSPVAVRYGWADYPVVNLWNKDGLPASPFRTDPETN